MSFSEINNSKGENNSSSDVDKRAEVSKEQDTKGTEKFDIDKRAEASKGQDTKDTEKFDIDKRAEMPQGQDTKDTEKFDIDKRAKFEKSDKSETDEGTDVQQNQDDNNENNNSEPNQDNRIETSSENAYEKSDDNGVIYWENGKPKPNIKYTIDGITYKTDDNGNVYRIGNELLPNNTYDINGYKYKTDEKGRIISAEGKLQPKEHEGRRKMEDSMSDIGKGDQKQTDDRGHLIGDQFNGSPALENLVPQDSKLNQNEVEKLENSLAAKVKNGNEVYLKIEPHYSDDSRRPDSFTYTYTINGETSVNIFRNGE